MDNLDSPFTIEIDGTPIAKIEGTVHDRPVHASLGSDSAVFTLQDKRLKCGDLVLARNKTEDRSLLPKQVLWFPVDSAELVQPVTVQKDGDEYRIKFGGMYRSTTGKSVARTYCDFRQVLGGR